MPLASSTNAPKEVTLVTVPWTTSPIRKKLSISVHGSVASCFMPREMRCCWGSTSSTIASTSSPFLRSSLGWLILRVHDMSETCTMPSMPSSSSMNAP